MTEITDLSETDSANTIITGNSTDGNIANMSAMDNVIQSILGLLKRSLKSSIWRLRDSTDQTKLLAFDLSGLTTATTKTIAVPNFSGTASVSAKGTDIASAATTDIWSATGDFVHITGATTITSFGAGGQSGWERTVVFDGSLTLTHNGATLALPGSANITTAAGDSAVVRCESAGVARVITYTKRSNPPLGAAENVAFTPVVIGLTTAGVGTYTTQTGTYSRTGNVVTFKIALVWTAHTGTGLAAIDGLPFVASANDTVLSIIASNYTLSPSNIIMAFQTGNTSRISLGNQVVGGGTFASINVDTNATLYISGSYQI